MQDDVESYAELIKNNPFWEVFNSQFETLQAPAPPEYPEITAPNDAFPIEAYFLYGLFISIACIWFLINKGTRRRLEKSFPKIYFDEKYKWYYYTADGEKPSLMTGDETWMPKNYYFDINLEGFYSNKNSNDTGQKVTIEEIRKATLPRIPAIFFPILFVAAGFIATHFAFQLKYNDSYLNYLELVAQREYQMSLFDPFEGMCQLNSKNALIPQQLNVQIVYDLPAGSNPPIAIEKHLYLEGDILSIENTLITLPVQTFLHNSPDQIVGDAGQNINFRERSATTNENCIQGNTYFVETDPVTENPVAYLVPVNSLKILSLGSESGLYETKLFGTYDGNYLINASSYEVRSMQYRYSIDNLPGCDSVSEGPTYTPGYRGNGTGFEGEIVPWGTSPTETINVPNFQMCSSVLHLEYQ